MLSCRSSGACLRKGSACLILTSWPLLGPHCLSGWDAVLLCGLQPWGGDAWTSGPALKQEHICSTSPQQRSSHFLQIYVVAHSVPQDWVTRLKHAKGTFLSQHMWTFQHCPRLKRTHRWKLQTTKVILTKEGWELPEFKWILGSSLCGAANVVSGSSFSPRNLKAIRKR